MTHKNIVIANFIAVSVVCVIAFGVWLYFSISARAEVRIDPNTLYAVTNVVDGDTFKAQVGQSTITIRVLGINTPETVDPRKAVECYGPEASHEAKELLASHKVKLAFNPNREMKDKYGRYLTYVYRDDGLFYNEFMIQEGYAKEYTYGTAYTFQKQFRADQKAAQDAKKGLWSVCVKK